WNLGIGVRYDRNHDVDADGAVTSRDSRLSPRLSAQWDATADGRHRVIATHGVYAARIADTIAASSQVAGNATSIDFAYRGPAIDDKALTVPLPDALRMLFDYFNGTQGGTANT